MVSTPSAVKSFVLKYMEICHILDKQSNLAIERSERVSTRSTLSTLLGLSPRLEKSPDLSPAEVTSLKSQAIIAREIFNIFRGSIEIMDEVSDDTIPHLSYASGGNTGLRMLFRWIYCCTL